MNAKKNTTIYDIARATALSPSTISKILNQKGNYPQETIDKVLSAARQLKYVPNIKARQLAEKSTKTLAVFFPSVPNGTHITNMLSGITNKAFSCGYSVTLFNNHLADTGQITEKIHEFDGIIFPIVSSDIVDYMAFLEQQNKPFSYAGHQRLFDREKRHFYGGYYNYIRDVLDIYYHKGRRRLVLFPQIIYSDFQKGPKKTIQSIIDTFTKEHQLPKDFCVLDKYAEESPSSLIPVLEKHLQSAVRPDALFFNSIPACITAYNYLQQKNLRIPEDIAIISTGHIAYEGLEFSPSLSTIYVHAYEMGERAVELLMHQIDPQKFPAVDNDIPYTYIQRESS